MRNTRTSIDVSADIGELDGSAGRLRDSKLAGFISSASIACGLHAGDSNSMRETALICADAGVIIGAHPSYPDRPNFGRLEMNLSPAEIRRCVAEQIESLANICESVNAALRFVKPHGALYNRAATDIETADAITAAIVDVDDSLTLLALAGSEMIAAATRAHIRSAREAFLDRAYTADGTLAARSLPGAVFTSSENVVERTRDLVHQNRVSTIHGSELEIIADSVCIHGDGPRALLFVQAVKQALQEDGVQIKSFAT